MAKDKELTEKQSAFLEALFAEVEGDVRAAMDAAGYSRTTPASVILESLHDEIVDRSRRYIAAHSAKAAMAMVGALKSPATLGIQNKLRAAEQLLDRAGVVKQDKLEVSVGDSGGLFLLPAKKTD